MYRFILPLSVLAPHDSNLALNAQVCCLFCVLCIPLFGLVQARPWFWSSMWISSVAGVSKIILWTSVVAGATCTYARWQTSRVEAWRQSRSKSSFPQIHVHSRKRSYDWLTASKQKWLVHWADIHGEESVTSPKSVCLGGYLTLSF